MILGKSKGWNGTCSQTVTIVLGVGVRRQKDCSTTTIDAIPSMFGVDSEFGSMLQSRLDYLPAGLEDGGLLILVTVH